MTTNEFATHAQYNDVTNLWRKCRDCTRGQTAVKEQGPLYLVQPSAMTDHSYVMYLNRAEYLNTPGKTLTSMAGSIVRKPPMVRFPDPPRLSEIGYQSESLSELIFESVTEQIRVGRVGILTDAADGEQAKDPYVTLYRAESILNWHSRPWEGRKLVSLVVLAEVSSTVVPPYYERVEVARVRVLRLIFPEDLISLDEEARVIVADHLSRSEDPVYVQELWVNVDSDKGPNGLPSFPGASSWVRERVIVPEKSDGSAWSEIPFVFLNAESTTPDVEEPPLLDLCDMALGYYRSSASLEWGEFWTAIPTPVVWLPNDDGKNEYPIGPSKAWVIRESIRDSDAKMLEYTGGGLSGIQFSMKRKVTNMAIMGSRLLQDSPSGVESADTVRLRMAGESATLGSIVLAASEAWTQVLRFWVGWTPTLEPQDVLVEINSDVHPTRLMPGEIATLSQALTLNQISPETFFHNLMRGEIIPAGVNFETERSLIQKQVDTLIEQNTDVPFGGPIAQDTGTAGPPDAAIVGGGADGQDPQKRQGRVLRSTVNQHSRERIIPRPG